LEDATAKEAETMCRTALVASIIVALAPQLAAADIVRHRNIPKAYQGTWATGAESCAPEKGAIVLSERTYTSPSADCTVVYVDETAGPRGSTFSARLSCSDAAGGGTKSAANLIIRPDRDGIMVGPTFDSLVTYQRCRSNGDDEKP
jgi:hypothetical protein